jgi:PAS domain S-box-containing protein
MNAHGLANVHLSDGVSASKFLDSLANLHPMVWVADREGHVHWMSEALTQWCQHEGLAPNSGIRGRLREQAKPEQIEGLRKDLTSRGCIGELRVDLCSAGGARLPVVASVLMFCTTVAKDPLFVLVGRPAQEGRAPGPEALDPVLQSAPDPILVLDERGVITQANAELEKLLGFPADDLRQRPFAALVSNAVDLEKFAAELPSGDPGPDHDLVMRTANASTLRVTASVSALRGADTPGTIVVLREQTARRQGHAELVRKTEELEHCVQALAHDLRSPLVALLGFSRLLRQDYGELLDETGSHFVDRIEQAGRTMERLIHDVLELSRIGRSGERRSLVDPRIVLLQLEAELKPRLDAESIGLDFPESPPMVYCDRTRLYQVFSNLIGNAVNHMGACEDRTVSVEIVEMDDHHRLSVRDRGMGIPAESQEAIFEAFRCLAPREGSRRGTGIGLAIVKKIAETHGGRAWVESDPGQGAAFHVTLSRD